MGRMVVVEYSSFFAVRDTHTGQERPMGDGVDTLFDADRKALPPGTPGFCKAWAEALNADESEALAACFLEQHREENGA